MGIAKASRWAITFSRFTSKKDYSHRNCNLELYSVESWREFNFMPSYVIKFCGQSVQFRHSFIDLYFTYIFHEKKSNFFVKNKLSICCIQNCCTTVFVEMPIKRFILFSNWKMIPERNRKNRRVYYLTVML